MWSDNETSLDLLNVQHLVAATAGVVRNDDLLPATIGIFGGWGSGKSSLIGMVREELEGNEDVVCISFNGWLFEGYEDAKAALMGTILDEVVANRTLGEKAKGLATKLLRRVDWFRLMGLAGKSALSLTMSLPPGGVDALLGAATTSAQNIKPEELQELAKNAPDVSVRQTVREFHQDFATLLEETNIRTLVVFIDDLDRCLPDTVIATLEAIRLFLFAPRTAFVIGADEDLVKHAVKRRFPEVEGSALDVGSDYLEKLIQFPIRIPPLGRAELETYMNLLLTQLHVDKEPFEEMCVALLDRPPDAITGVGFDRAKAEELLEDVSSDLIEDLSLAEQTADILASGLEGNPRQTKRFLNTLVLREDMAKARTVVLRRRVLVKLMLLEYFRTETFRELASWQSAQEGKPKEVDYFEQRIRRESPEPETLDEEGTAEPEEEQEDLSPEGNAESSETDDSSASMTTVAQWLDDDWLVDWVVLDPPLRGVDLRPYFYFAREQIGALSGPSRRMSREARTVFARLSSRSEADRIAGADQLNNLSEADASAVFGAVADLVRREEDLGSEDSPLDALYRLTEVRTELAGETVKLFDSLSESQITVRIPPLLIRATKTTQAEAQAQSLLKRWSNSASNTMLASAAKNVLRSQESTDTRRRGR